MQPTGILDPAQLVDRVPARCVDDIIAKLFLRAWQAQPGPLPLGRMQMITDPAEVSDLLSRPDDFGKHYSFLKTLGKSRFDSDGADWEMRRDFTQPLYREAARMANRHHIRDTYARWLSDDAVQSGTIGRALLAAASEVFLNALGGRTPTGPVADWLLSLRDTAVLAQHIAMFDPSPAQLAATQAQVRMLRTELRAMLARDSALTAHLNTRLAQYDTTIDLLGEVTINMFAGTETTVASICWALAILARQPKTQDRIAADIVLHGDDAPSLTHFIQEVMRYCPPVPLLVRNVLHADETLAGRPVPQGQTIAMSIVGMHHHTAHWDSPSQFDAARPEFVQNTYHRRVYLPFSAGPRVCGGIGLARAEVATALSIILKRFRIASDSSPISYSFSLTLRPLGTSKLRFEPR